MVRSCGVRELGYGIEKIFELDQRSPPLPDLFYYVIYQRISISPSQTNLFGRAAALILVPNSQKA